MSRLRITVAYDGSAYGGWQVQPNAPTVQAAIEDALRQLTGATVKVHGSGRTDQGVHAIGQVAHFDLPVPFEPGKLLRAMNALLADDIRVMAVRRAAADFHARRSAKSKEYRYFVWNDAVLPPHLRRYRTHVRQPLDVAAMRRAAAVLVGVNDFAAFTVNPHRHVESTVRRLDALDVRQRGREICVVARAEGFLYKMVRSLAGHLLRVGEGRVAAESTREILESKTRTARVETAPPEGLFLWRVMY